MLKVKIAFLACLLATLCWRKVGAADNPASSYYERTWNALYINKWGFPMEFTLEQLDNLRESNYDAIVVIATSIKESFEMLDFGENLRQFHYIDDTFRNEMSVLQWNEANLIHLPTGPIDRDQDDVRIFTEAAEKGVASTICTLHDLAIRAGALRIAIVIPKNITPFTKSSVDASCLLGSLKALYVPLEVRKDPKQERNIPVIEKIGLVNFSGGQERLNFLLNIEYGRKVARDLAGANPEYMAPPRFAEHVRKIFQTPQVKVTILSNITEIEARYPLCAAVSRATKVVPRHHPRVIHLEYVPQDGNYSKTVGLVGKGVTFDTGGVDVKPTGRMRGMHRDKAGASAVVGVFAALKRIKPQNVKVVGAICVTRNSIGSDAYIPDEILTSRSGYRVRVTNTDLEGRLTMADILDEMRETVQNEPNPQILTVATLTGHAQRTVGLGYTVAMDNGVARERGISMKLQQHGEDVGEMFEISTIRREDYTAVGRQSPYEDLTEGHSQPTTQVNRGHQIPAAFLIRVSRLDKHGKNSEKPISYTHLDMAASDGPNPGISSGVPVASIITTFVQNIP